MQRQWWRVPWCRCWRWPSSSRPCWPMWVWPSLQPGTIHWTSWIPSERRGLAECQKVNCFYTCLTLFRHKHEFLQFNIYTASIPKTLRKRSSVKKYRIQEQPFVLVNFSAWRVSANPLIHILGCTFPINKLWYLIHTVALEESQCLVIYQESSL